MVYFQWNLKSSLNSIRKSDLIKLFNACKWLFNLALKYVSTIKLLCWYFSVFTRKRDHWSDPLISDLIPKISQKSENFGKILWPYFSVSKTDPKMKFDFFLPTQLSNKLKIELKIWELDIYLKNGKFWKKLFCIEISVKFWVYEFQPKKFLIHESKVMKHFLFLKHQRF